MSVEPLAVGLVGAGPWASMFHAPMLAAGPHTRLAGIWARRPEAASALADRWGTVSSGSYADLLEGCEAVAFAVPPDVQAALAPRAAGAGRHLLLEKPLALDRAGAEAVAEAADRAGVVTQLVLTSRYTPAVRAFLAEAGRLSAVGGRCASISASLLEGPFVTPWRVRHGALLDLGPHVLDLMDASLGPIEAVSARGDPLSFVAVTSRHRSGAVGQAALSMAVRGREVWSCEVYAEEGTAVFDAAGLDMESEWAAARRAIPEELATCVRSGTPHRLDAARGLHLQRLIDQAAASLEQP